MMTSGIVLLLTMSMTSRRGFGRRTRLEYKMARYTMMMTTIGWWWWHWLIGILILFCSRMIHMLLVVHVLCIIISSGRRGIPNSSTCRVAHVIHLRMIWMMMRRMYHCMLLWMWMQLVHHCRFATWYAIVWRSAVGRRILPLWLPMLIIHIVHVVIEFLMRIMAGWRVFYILQC